MHLQKFEIGETVIIPEQKSWPPHPAAVGVVVGNSYEEWAQQKVIRITAGCLETRQTMMIIFVQVKMLSLP